jgi:hypothetical protein
LESSLRVCHGEVHLSYKKGSTNSLIRCVLHCYMHQFDWGRKRQLAPSSFPSILVGKTRWMNNGMKHMIRFLALLVRPMVRLGPPYPLVRVISIVFVVCCCRFVPIYVGAFPYGACSCLDVEIHGSACMSQRHSRSAGPACLNEQTSCGVPSLWHMKKP